MKNKKNYVINMEVMLFLALISLILFHFNVNLLYMNNKTHLILRLKYFHVNLGDIAVSIFIIVLGVFLAIKIREEDSLSNLYKKFFLLVMPPFWLTYIIVILFNKPSSHGQYWKFILTLIGMDGFFLYRMSNFYLIGEWIFGSMIIIFLLSPIIYFRVKKRPLKTFLTILILNIIVHIFYGNIFKIPEICNPIMRLLDLSFGMLFVKCIYEDKNEVLRKIFIFIGIVYLLFSGKMIKILPYNYHMIIVGFSVFVILEYFIAFFKLENEKISLKQEKRIANILLYVFFIHHQIIILFFKKFSNIVFMKYTKKILVLFIIIFISFVYGIVVTLITEKIKFLNKR
mgnify:CR=1 FL=1